MFKRILSYLGLEEQSEYLKGFMSRSNMEVMRAVSHLYVIIGIVGFGTTLVNFHYWLDKPDWLITEFRFFFVALVATGAVFRILADRYVHRGVDDSRTAGRLLCAMIVILLALSTCINILDFPYTRSWFYIIMAGFVCFGLFYIPTAFTALSMLWVCGITISVLSFQGYSNPSRITTLIIYAVLAVAVSSASYRARIRAGKAAEAMHSGMRCDELTGTLNRRAFDEDVLEYVGEDIYLILSDIDEFKYYNDLHGHSMGDKLLNHYAESMVRAFGKPRVYRFGGDEYVAVCLASSDERAHESIERWRDDFHHCTIDGNEYSPTCSAGCVHGHVKDEEAFRSMMRLADMGLYQAKESGRNTVVYSEYVPELETNPEAETESPGEQEIAVVSDSLTGLPDAYHFYSHAAAAVPAMLGHGTSVDFVYFNVGNLKEYNVRYGFEAGDELLKFVADSIREAFPNRLLAHFGDDHFVLMAEDDGIAEKINAVHTAVLAYHEDQLTTIRAGIYRYTDASVEVRVACDLAKLACDSIRGRFNECYRYYSEDLGTQAALRQHVLERFNRAIANGYIHVYYQPIIRCVSNQLSECEALVRWIDPEEGLMNPGDFIPALEEARLIHLLDLNVIEQVCKNYHELLSKGLPVFPTSVNLSRLDFEVSDIVERVAAIIHKYEMPPDMLRIEITENAFMNDPELLKHAVSGFHELGLQVWMDDFGSGYSSLNVLREYDFDVVKIDMRFISGLTDPRMIGRSHIMLMHIIGMVKELGLSIFAEGVEEPSQMGFLRDVGCEKLQGFIFSRPVPFEELCGQLAENPERVEQLGRRSFFDAVAGVNILRPVSANEQVDPTKLARGVPMAVLEVGDRIRYFLSNRPYRENLAGYGIESIARSEELLTNEDPNAEDGLRCVVGGIEHVGDWARVRLGTHTWVRYAWARLVAIDPVTGVRAALLFLPPYYGDDAV